MPDPFSELPVLAEPQPTAYDVNFRIFGFPVRIHPLFWLGSVLLGATALDRGILFLLIWIAVVLVSILVHELGHALAFKWFGTRSHIVLYVFGGLAVPWNRVSGHGRNIVIALAGPIAGFLFCAAVYASQRIAPWAGNSAPLASLYLTLIFVNLYWGIFNLLPVFPLDGGQVSQEICGAVWRRNGLRVALQISIGFALVVTIYSLACELERKNQAGWFDALPWWFPAGSLWTAILFGMLAMQSYQVLQQLHWMSSGWDDPGDRSVWHR